MRTVRVRIRVTPETRLLHQPRHPPLHRQIQSIRHTLPSSVNTRRLRRSLLPRLRRPTDRTLLPSRTTVLPLPMFHRPLSHLTTTHRKKAIRLPRTTTAPARSQPAFPLLLLLLSDQLHHLTYNQLNRLTLKRNLHSLTQTLPAQATLTDPCRKAGSRSLIARAQGTISLTREGSLR